MDICYGSRIRLQHKNSGVMLHSHPFNYTHNGTSGQQQVTGFSGSDTNDYWIVKGPHAEPQNFHEGAAVQNGDTIRLEHLLTRKNLHSHNDHPSPESGQREVTCYGQFGLGDDNDNWGIEVDTGGSWNTTKRIRLIHRNSHNALHSHSDHAHVNSIMNQQEVTCFSGRDDNDWWIVLDEGWLGFPIPNTCGAGSKTFYPSQWAFHFENNFKNMPLRTINIGGIEIPVQAGNAGRCGGMVFAVRDYFEAGLLLPIEFDVPQTNTALFNYIADRLIDSFDIAHGGPEKWKRLSDPNTPDGDQTIGSTDQSGIVSTLGGLFHEATGQDDPSKITTIRGRAWTMINEEWPQIKAELDDGKVCPIGLVLSDAVSYDIRNIGNNHTVLAYGYDLRGNDLTIHIYDPNRPYKYDTSRIDIPRTEGFNRTWCNSDNQTIRLDIGNPEKVTDVWSSYPYNIRCFFRLNYTGKTPPSQTTHSKNIRFKTANGSYLAPESSTNQIKATGAKTDAASVFTIKNVRDPQLKSGDSINIVSNRGKYLSAELGGGGVINANRAAGKQWEVFVIKRFKGEGEIVNNNQVALRALNGKYICAEGGGGAEVNANRDVVGSWETFTIEFV